MDITGILHYLLVLSQSLYMTCLLPQVVTNYKIKSGTGLSDLFAIGYLNGHFAQLFYVFCLNLPIGYKIFVPVQFLIVLVLIFQRLYYDRFANRALTLFYAVNIACAIALIPVACRIPLLCGTTNGWLSLIIFSLSQIPQVYKIYTTRSVQGFSIMFVVVMGCGSVLELLGSIFLGLPIQTIFNAVRNTTFVAACLGAFFLYGRKGDSI